MSHPHPPPDDRHHVRSPLPPTAILAPAFFPTSIQAQPFYSNTSPPQRLRVPVMPSDSSVLLQAAQVIAEMSTQTAVGSSWKSQSQRGRRRRKLTKDRSQILIIGPFKSQVLDLSSSSGSSATSTPQEAVGRPSSTIPSLRQTPSLIGGHIHSLTDAPPTPPTDWVAYSAPMSEFSELDDMFVDSSFESTDLTFELPRRKSETDLPKIQEPLPKKDILVDDSPVSPPVDKGLLWTRSLLQRLHTRNSPPRRLAPHSAPNRIPLHKRPKLIPIPIPFSQESTPASSSLGTSIRTVPSSSSRTVPSSSIRTAPASSTRSIPFASTRTVASAAPRTVIPTTPRSTGSALVKDESNSSSPTRLGEQALAEADLFNDTMFVCVACDGRVSRVFNVNPCEDLVCPTCFSSALSAVSVTQGAAKCPACMEPVTTFETYKPVSYIAVRGPNSRKANNLLPVPEPWTYETSSDTIVMRIDNVAWDVEPLVVERFLPPNVLPTRQNMFMPGGRVTAGRKRAVTITQVTHVELNNELRPGSKAELASLLELCEAALTMPPPQLRLDSTGRGRLHASVGSNGKAHYIKHRHAPFHAIISIMLKLAGPDSPAYWDIYHVTSGAIAALGSYLQTNKPGRNYSYIAADRALLHRLKEINKQCFGNALEA
ncbi:uncharacterized protein EHS24_009293 [Apiotrichum porosum]|uniref:Uncharacterized protein n=1 Tax=Apiotrichum porosum TaxID=105984 RepID=A0A427XL82_9TREE|nr:uncharacterized protein EHS24_009293 [Apiotrichum porosum]RSH79641.1 hypothetical protein EHS24_009293 [Apiotrichum porosum]